MYHALLNKLNSLAFEETSSDKNLQWLLFHQCLHVYVKVYKLE
jgi:hypothetical protein